MGPQLLGGLAPARFLSQYWQKKPLLVRRAIPAFAGIVMPPDLFRLAAREDVASKLFLLRGPHWTGRPAPGARPPRALFSRLHRWYLHGWLLIGERHG